MQSTLTSPLAALEPRLRSLLPADLYAIGREGRVAVVGSQAAIDAANAQRGGDWLRVTKVL